MNLKLSDRSIEEDFKDLRGQLGTNKAGFLSSGNTDLDSLTSEIADFFRNRGYEVSAEPTEYSREIKMPGARIQIDVFDSGGNYTTNPENNGSFFIHLDRE